MLNMPLIQVFKSLTITAALACSVIAQDRPNIVFFLVDDMGIEDCSVPFAYDSEGKAIITPTNKLYRTPNMEKLAASGITFTQAYSYSICSPTRVSLVTGQAAPRHRVTQWTHPTTYKNEPGNARTKTIKSPKWNTKGVPQDVPLLPKLIQQSGYRTLFAGKAHFGPDDTPMGDPKNLGFDVSIAGFGGGGPGSYYGSFNYSAEHRNGGRQWDIPDLEKYHGTETFLTEAITLEMNAAISQSVEDKKPFFSYMSHYALHVPFLYPDLRFTKNYPTLKGDALAHATLVKGMDKSLGDIVSHLDGLGVAEDTLIIFFSDNGSVSPLGTSTLRGQKGTRFEGGTRVPLIVAWAKTNPNNKLQQKYPIHHGARESDIVSCLDMMPTLLALTGAKTPKNIILDGANISGYITGKSKLRRPQSFLCHFPHSHYNSLFSTYRNGDYKIIYNYANQNWELYNLAVDRKEQHNLISKQPDLARSLAKSMVLELDSQDALYPVSIKSGQPVKPDLSGIK